MAALSLNRRTMLASFAAVAAVAGCDRKGAAPVNGGKPKFGTFGFDTAGMDRAVAPGDDFFQYANGTWARTTEIPADRSSYNAFTSLTEQALTRNRAIVEEAAAAKSAKGDTKKVGDYFAAFMDEAGIEARGVAPIRPDLDRIAAIADRSALSREVGATIRADVDLLNATNYYTSRPFGLWISQDLDNPKINTPYLVQGGLGLPDRSFYLDGGRMADIRTQYRAHIAKVLSLAGIADAEAKAGRILDHETRIARVHATQVETNDVERGANHWSRADFVSRAPGFDWDALFAAAGLETQQLFIVWQPAAVTGMAALAASQPLDVWKDYLQFRALDRASPFLAKAFADENFAFYGAQLNGTPQQQERWKRAINHTNNALGEAVGKIYVERHFTPDTKAKADTMVKNIVAAFGQRIDRLEWMSAETKDRARRKLGTLKVDMGYPSTWRDYSALEIRRDDALGNVQRAELFEYRRNLAKLGRPVEHTEWYMLPQVVNALNIPLENRLIFPAAILEPPFFDPNADPAINYGAIGGVIGHEITHSFDSTGALFDETGRLADWWTPADLAKFEAAGTKLADQYSSYKPFPDVSLNGRLTLGENIADVAGLATSYDAWRLSLGGKEAPVLEGFSGDQRFYLGWAQVWRAKFREQALRNYVLTGVHSPGQYRAATVRNQDPWYAAFDVKPGQKLYLAPDDRVKVW
ncbi:MAG TPA: M13 family metallopeptidase [Caulobacteraceae bacterium]|nr:M13 family metallopeptidase [Caulobacteraceae bacterium]